MVQKTVGRDSSDLKDAGTVARVAQLLRIAAEAEGPFTLTSVTTRTGLSPATVHRLLDLLVREGLVARDPVKRSYRVGAELFRLGAIVFNKIPFREIAGPILQHAAGLLNETCYFALYLPAEGRLMFAEKADSPHELNYRFELNRPLSLVWGSSGRVVLAFLPQERARSILEAETERNHAGRRAPSWRELSKELEQIRAQGYAHSHGQRVPHAVGVIAPVFEHNNEIYGSLGYTIPETRFGAQQLEAVARAAVEHANQLSRALGATAERVAQR